jgi:23S rRNA (pseudouridine1915-N3)-methyltransferase
MRLMVAAIGRLKSGSERELAERYRNRAEQLGRRIGFRSTDIVEIRESRAQDVGKRMIEESIALMNIIPDKAVTVIMDERGENLDSAALAALLRRWRDDGRPAAVFVIGGDDGLAESLRERASLRLALAPPPGRISLFASCCSSRFIALSRSFRGTRTTERNVAFALPADYLGRPWAPPDR